MVKGDIVKYTHREGQEFYGVVKRQITRDGYSVDILTHTNMRPIGWADGFTCHINKLELVEGV